MKTTHSLLLLLLCLACLCGCRSPLIASLTTAAGEPYFEADFSETMGDFPSASLPEGSYAFVDGEYHLGVTAPSSQLWALSGGVYEDVRVEVDAFRLAGPQVNLYGLVCRASAEGSYYFFIVSSDGYYAIGKRSAGQSSLLGQETMAYNAIIATGSGINHLRFDCTGSTLAGYVNGKMLALTGDLELKQGDAGLIAGSFEQGGVEVAFDNFTIFKP